MDAEHAVPFDYAAVTPDAVRRAVEGAIARSEGLVESIAAVPEAGRTVENTLLPLEEIGDALGQAGGRYGFLSQVSPQPQVRAAAHEYEERLDTYATGLGFREEIAGALRALDGTSAERALEPAVARLLEFELRDYRRNGMDLDAATRGRVQGLKERLVSLGIAFRRNIDEHEDAILVDRAGLTGLPESYVERLRSEGEGEARRYRISLDYPELAPFLENAENGALREALFHEFGHVLHQTLTRARFLRFSGTSVERDFVEAPSQMLEHWCWDPDVLRGFTRHYRTGDPIPEALVKRMVAAKNVSSGIATLRQIYLSRLDLAYHAPGAQKETDAIARELHVITGFAFPEETHFQAGFGHLFGYDAGYYGYLWSKVSGDDMFTRFEEAGLRDAGVGRDYRRGILERGGSVDGDGLVREFLGREPSPAAFLRDLGLDEIAPGAAPG